MTFSWDLLNLELFWHWISERQKAFYRRKVLREPPPWSSDPVVANVHFTNVYRELDPGTIWLRRNVLNNKALEDDEKAFLAMAYRLFGTEDVFEYLQVQLANTGAMFSGTEYGGHPMLPSQFNEHWVSAKLRELMDAGRQAFTPAYMVSNYGDPRPKPVVIAEVLGRAAREWDNTWRAITAARDRRGVWVALMGVYGIGRFVAFQALVDLCYPLPGSRSGVLPYSNDDWVAAGPGAQKGLKLLWSGFRLDEDNEAIERLVQIQEPNLEALGFPWLVDDRGKRIHIDRSNMQNCLCEFSKYHRLRFAQNKGGRKRAFDCASAVERDERSPLARDTRGALLSQGTLGLAVQVDAFI